MWTASPVCVTTSGGAMALRSPIAALPQATVPPSSVGLTPNAPGIRRAASRSDARSTNALCRPDGLVIDLAADGDVDKSADRVGERSVASFPGRGPRPRRTRPHPYPIPSASSSRVSGTTLAGLDARDKPDLPVSGCCKALVNGQIGNLVRWTRPRTGRIWHRPDGAARHVVRW